MTPTAVLPRLPKLLLLLAAVAPAGAGANYTCAPRPDGTCGGAAAVCGRCCKADLGDEHACHACVAAECTPNPTGPVPDDVCARRATNNTSCPPDCIKECTLKTPLLAPCLRDCHLCDTGGPLLFLVLLPMAGRAVFDWALGWLKAKCVVKCWKKEAAADQPLLQSAAAGFKMKELHYYDDFRVGWKGARDKNGLRPCGALGLAAARLLLWHWLPPVVYFMVLGCHWTELDAVQRGFGAAVAVREVLYIAATLLGLCANPAFLLVDVGASVRDTDQAGASGGWPFLALYALAPEKYVMMAAFGRSGLKVAGLQEVNGLDFGYFRNNGRCAAISIVGVVGLLDLAAVGGLVAGLAVRNLPPALAVGYGATALGLGCLVVLKLLQCCGRGKLGVKT
eukprot:COSAG01_NODE_4960_length_4589_cov_2.312249_5_plen_394_part_00